MARPVCILARLVPRHSGRAFDNAMMRLTILIVLSGLFACGCSSAPKLTAKRPVHASPQKAISYQ